MAYLIRMPGRIVVHRGLLCRALTVRRPRAGRLFDRADLGVGELGVDEELERVELLVLLHEAVQRGAAQPGQGAAGGVAQQARLDDLQREGVIALADEGGGGGRELLVPAPGEQVEGGGVPPPSLGPNKHTGVMAQVAPG